MFEVNDILQTFDKPRIYLRQFLDAFYGIAFLECLSKSKDTEVCRVSEFLVEVVEIDVLVAHKAVHALTYHSQALLQHLFERATDAHNLTNRLHA